MIQPDSGDLSNFIGAMKPNPTPDSHLVEEGMANLSLSGAYEWFDQFSRDAIFFVADETGMGLGVGIVIMSCLLKLFFLPTQMIMVLLSH